MTDNIARSPRTEFLGVEFDQLDFDEVLSWLSTRSCDDCYGYIVTPNVDHLVRLDRECNDFAVLYSKAILRLCDSRVISRLARMAGIALPVVPGSDLVVALFSTVISPGDCITVIGGREAMLTKLRTRYPAIQIYHVNAPMGLRDAPLERAKIVAALPEQGARFTLIAVGSPQQEMLALDMLNNLAMRGTALCIGASIDFIVGDQLRAPRAVQQMGLEWAWRLASNPRRLWRRYLVEGPRIFQIFRTWRRTERELRRDRESK